MNQIQMEERILVALSWLLGAALVLLTCFATAGAVALGLRWAEQIL